jgi:hypothetical protein
MRDVSARVLAPLTLRELAAKELAVQQLRTPSGLFSFLNGAILPLSRQRGAKLNTKGERAFIPDDN